MNSATATHHMETSNGNAAFDSQDADSPMQVAGWDVPPIFFVAALSDTRTTVRQWCTDVNIPTAWLSVFADIWHEMRFRSPHPAVDDMVTAAATLVGDVDRERLRHAAEQFCHAAERRLAAAVTDPVRETVAVPSSFWDPTDGEADGWWVTTRVTGSAAKVIDVAPTFARLCLSSGYLVFGRQLDDVEAAFVAELAGSNPMRPFGSAAGLLDVVAAIRADSSPS